MWQRGLRLPMEIKLDEEERGGEVEEKEDAKKKARERSSRESR